MECKICKKNKFTAGNKWELKNGYYKRKRKCINCGHTIITIELPEDEFNKHMTLVDDLKKVIQHFMKN